MVPTCALPLALPGAAGRCTASRLRRARGRQPSTPRPSMRTRHRWRARAAAAAAARRGGSPSFASRQTGSGSPWGAPTPSSTCTTASAATRRASGAAATPPRSRASLVETSRAAPHCLTAPAKGGASTGPLGSSEGSGRASKPEGAAQAAQGLERAQRLSTFNQQAPRLGRALVRAAQQLLGARATLLGRAVRAADCTRLRVPRPGLGLLRRDARLALPGHLPGQGRRHGHQRRGPQPRRRAARHRRRHGRRQPAPLPVRAARERQAQPEQLLRPRLVDARVRVGW